MDNVTPIMQAKSIPVPSVEEMLVSIGGMCAEMLSILQEFKGLMAGMTKAMDSPMLRAMFGGK